MNRSIGRAFAWALTLSLSLGAQSSVAGPSGQYGADEPHLDALLHDCWPLMQGYRQVLEATNPPEVVEMSISGLIGTVRGVGTWSPADLAQRQAQARHDLAAFSNGDPAAAPTAVRACVVDKEVAARQRQAAGG